MGSYSILHIKRTLAAAVFLFAGVLIYGESSGTDIGNVSDEEKERFESAHSEVVSLRKSLEEEETRIVEEAPVPEKLINNIYRAYIDENRGLLDIAKEEEKEVFSRVMDKIFETQRDYREKMVDAIDGHGFTERRFYALLHEYEYKDEEAEDAHIGGGGVKLKVEPIGSLSNRIPGE